MNPTAHRLPNAMVLGPCRILCLAGFLAVNQPGACATERASPKQLTIDRLFKDKEFESATPPAVVWRTTGTGYYTLEESTRSGSGRDLVRHDPATERREVIVPAAAFVPPGETQPLAIDQFQLSADESKILIYTQSKRVWRQKTRGDYWLLDMTTHELRQLGGKAAPSTLMFAKLSPDGRHAAYVHENNLCVEEASTGHILPLTTNGSATLINGTFDWVYEEELDLRDGFCWSPDSQSIAYWQLVTSGVREFYLINNTDQFYSQPIPIRYPKTGEDNAAARIGVVSRYGGPTRWLAVPGDPRQHYLARMQWASNSTEIILQQFNRRQNTNQVFIAQVETGEVRPLLVETDAAWVENVNPIFWIRAAREFLWLSEREGWRQLYRVTRDGQRMHCLTKGQYDVIEIQAVDHAHDACYFTASPDQATQCYLYRIALRGGKPRRVTPDDQAGTHAYQISTDARWAVHTYSTFNQPPVTELIRLPEHETVRVLEDNQKLRDKLAELAQPGSEFFRVNIGDGVCLDGWCLKPPAFDATRTYPVLIQVYGEPAGRTVADAWRGPRHLWHWLLAQQGYVILSVDNRGTAVPRGRAWRKSIYRQVGLLAAADQAAALRALQQRWSWIDPTRVGIWGWSGGGSMTLNAMFRYPDLYQVGMAIAPVPNQRYYDTIYQERYMGLPGDNPEGYRNGSPIHLAHQLTGQLLLVHGTADDNCHYQGTEALINELIQYNKPFTMMAYPNCTHAIEEGSNTRRHLFELLTRFLRQHLPVAPVPAVP